MDNGQFNTDTVVNSAKIAKELLSEYITLVTTGKSEEANETLDKVSKYIDIMYSLNDF